MADVEAVEALRIEHFGHFELPAAMDHARGTQLGSGLTITGKDAARAF